MVSVAVALVMLNANAMVAPLEAVNVLADVVVNPGRLIWLLLPSALTVAASDVTAARPIWPAAVTLMAMLS